MPHFTDEERQTVLRLHGTGLSQRAIAAETGVSQSSVSRILRDPVNRSARPSAPTGHRWCHKCQSFRLLGQFWKHRKAKDGLSSACKDCMSQQASVNRASMRYRVATVYGITLEQYDELRSTATKCAICGADGELHLDHNEETGKIRDFLCGRCNRGLGLFLHNPAALRTAADYMEKHGE